MMKRVLGACVVVSLLLASSSAWALPTLDQYQEATDGDVGGQLPWKFAQTFTAGLSGVLDHIDVGQYWAQVPGPSTIEIRDTVTGVPGNTILGTAIVPVPLAPGWNSIDFFPQSIPMTAGQMYSIVLIQSLPTTLLWAQVQWDPASYGPGASWEDDGSGTWQLITHFGGCDMRFRTYVETGAQIPAPGALLLSSLGSGVIVWLRRRRTL